MKTIKAKIFSVSIVIAASITLFFACKKTNSAGSNPPPEDLVTASVSGRVTDLNNTPVSNASVTAGAITTTTDGNGQFTIKNAQLNKDAGFVKIIMPGYFNGSRTFVTSANTVNNVKIQLIPKLVSGSFTTTSGGSVNVSGGGSVNFAANSVMNATTNTAYTGDVSVSTFYLNPADANFNQYMPGDLRGINTSNQQSILKAFGMASVEMNDAGAEKLQLTAGKKATIVLPIPSIMQASAPATIPLWYFDETKGLWKEEGVATKQNNTYTGTVGHFSFWAAGELTQGITLGATFKDSSGTIFANKLITISRTDSTATIGYTDSSGKVSGLVPANELLVMRAVNDCGQIVYTKNIGPFSADMDLGIIVINGNCSPVILDSTQYMTLSIKGTVYTIGSPVTQQVELDTTTGNLFTALQAGPDNLINYMYVSIYNGSTYSPGNYNCYISALINDSSYETPYYNSNTTTVTQFDSIGGFITGTASGWMKNYTGGYPSADSIPFTCNYKIKRTQ